MKRSSAKFWKSRSITREISISHRHRCNRNFCEKITPLNCDNCYEGKYKMKRLEFALLIKTLLKSSIIMLRRIRNVGFLFLFFYFFLLFLTTRWCMYHGSEILNSVSISVRCPIPDIPDEPSANIATSKCRTHWASTRKSVSILLLVGCTRTHCLN